MPYFKVQPSENKTLSWWHGRKEKIDMDPPYQRRGHLWSPTDKAYLIDSIINDFDVPKVYLADFTFSDAKINRKRLPYAIIDGKQRFEAIFDFFDGRIVLNTDFIFRGNPDLKLGGLGYKDLISNYRDIAESFSNYNLSVMSVITDNADLINELFVRLNRSKPLTGAEIRNAMAGPAPEVTRELAKHQFFMEHIAFPRSRGQDLNAAIKLLMFEFEGKPQETKKKTLDAFVRNSGDDRIGLELAARRVFSALDDMTNVFLPRDKLLSSSGILPSYYWFLRGLELGDYPLTRDFLVRFEEERKANRTLADMDESDRRVDTQLLEYDQLNRSTNDLTTQVKRVDILNQRFSKFKERPGRLPHL